MLIFVCQIAISKFLSVFAVFGHDIVSDISRCIFSSADQSKIHQKTPTLLIEYFPHLISLKYTKRHQYFWLCIFLSWSVQNTPKDTYIFDCVFSPPDQSKIHQNTLIYLIVYFRHLISLKYTKKHQHRWFCIFLTWSVHISGLRPPSRLNRLAGNSWSSCATSLCYISLLSGCWNNHHK